MAPSCEDWEDIMEEKADERDRQVEQAEEQRLAEHESNTDILMGGLAKLDNGWGQSWLCREYGCKLYKIEGGWACYGCGARYGTDTSGQPFLREVKGLTLGD